MSDAPTEPEVLFEVRGALGIITLNRPRAVNALTHGMVEAALDQLTAWSDDDSVACVMITGAGDRGLCAGGDIVAIYRDIPEGGAGTAAFWRTEYRLNALISNYPKPFIAFMDGLVLGGGVGISAHGSHRIVTERTRSGMPETTIGFVPDVGGLYLLSRAPGEAGTHAALTSSHLDAADALFLGLADAYVPSTKLADVATALEAVRRAEDVDRIIEQFAETAPGSALAGQATWMAKDYAGDSIERILGRLRVRGGHGAEAAELIAAKSPTAVKTTLAALRRAAGLSSLEEALDQDYRVGARMLASHDFLEGIRAQVIDKDRQPKWSPANFEQISPEMIRDYFEPLGPDEQGGELGLATDAKERA
ncbi:enoyl-CoA hydratase/isomerase family protein [Arthrobacter rhombi]|uniref:3-hydroxyisobutyryl-CoA hydrolase n=1 Tax=Arthrobacter rhombi TaxID=71253 RepID=A0A1R4G1I1_9MICC|nr:enoyl-CoA hydratase/isomerase family protein [Arthrobacter rhombi]SJM62034.1 3-hydroxyisobutyryl-CoA hydrolase [Arthrobacter rhombi]